MVPVRPGAERAPLRLLRALVLAGGADVIGAGSHVLGGGTVDLAGLLVTLPALLALTWPLTGRERGWLAILGVQLVGQQVAHLLFGLGAPAAHPALPVDAWFYGHVTAAVVVATWLRCAERRTWAAARRAAAAVAAAWRRLLRPLDPSGPEPAPAATPPAPVPPGPPRHPLRHVLVRRGPPLPA